MSNQLFRRQVIADIEPYLETQDVLIIHGARQVGKTSIMMYLQGILQQRNDRTIYIDLEDGRFKNLLDQGVDEFTRYLEEQGFSREDIEAEGKRLFVFIDEIQYLENPSSFLKLLADHHRYLKVIVSGSSSFEMKSKFKDSLVGRTMSFEIYPLSFLEFLTFKGEEFHTLTRYTDPTLSKLRSLFTEFLLYGGYPKIVLTKELGMKEQYLQQIIDTYIRKDIRDLAAIKNVDKFNRLLEILASQSGNLVNLTELSNTCSIARDTVENYLFLLEQTYIIRLVRPFSRNLRTELTKTPKVFFFDTGLMQMLSMKKLQREVIGHVFETGIFSELVKQYGAKNLNYWRTQDKKEIDFILRTPDVLIPVEAKLHFPKDIPSVLRDFNEIYPPKTVEDIGYRLVALEGRATENGMIYPWQL